MATFNVANGTELSSALGSAVGGDEIVLANGAYGTRDFTQTFASKVIVRAANALGASFTSLNCTGGSNIEVDGVACAGGFDAISCSDIGVLNSTFGSTIIFRASNPVIDGVTVESCDINVNQNSDHGLILDSVHNFTIRGNTIRNFRSDGVRVTVDSADGLIENNYITDSWATEGIHPDGIQMFSVGGFPQPRRITIRGNFIYDNPNTGQAGLYMQGIFLRQDPNEDMVVEQNLLAIGSPNTIAWNGGLNMIVRNNSLLSWSYTPGGNQSGGAGLRANGNQTNTTVEDNVYLSLLDNSNGTVNWDNNIRYNNTTSDPLYWGNLFETGDGSTWEGFVPKTGSVIDFGTGNGALTRLAELQGNPPPTPPAQAARALLGPSGRLLLAGNGRLFLG